MKEEHSRTGNEHNAMTEKMENKGGLIHAYLLDGSGGGRRLEMPDIESWRPEQGVLWMHFDYTDEDAQQ